VTQVTQLATIARRSASGLPLWAAPAATGAVALACCAVAGIADPTQPVSGLPACPFKTVTGWACPGCGSTRMLHTLVLGDIGSAARYNIVTLLMVPVLVWMWLTWTQRRLGYRALPIWRPSGRMLWIGLVLWMLYSVLRNLPWAPFSALNV